MSNTSNERLKCHRFYLKYFFVYKCNVKNQLFTLRFWHVKNVKFTFYILHLQPWLLLKNTVYFVAVKFSLFHEIKIKYQVWTTSFYNFRTITLCPIDKPYFSFHRSIFLFFSLVTCINAKWAWHTKEFNMLCIEEKPKRHLKKKNRKKLIT